MLSVLSSMSEKLENLNSYAKNDLTDSQIN